MEGSVVENTGSLHNYSTWEYLFTDLADPRTSKWFLMGNPLPALAILIAYNVFVLKIGPGLMKNRKPFGLKKTIMVYNLFQVAVNMYLFAKAVNMWSGYNWRCQPVDFSESPNAMRDAWGCYLYFLNKLTDLIDTIFFILRKKYKQATFLHIYHHNIMVLSTWQITKYFPGGHPTFIGLLNTFVHVILYAYYYVASLGPEVQKYLWWKKYITKIQLIQFALVFLHYSQLFYYNCGVPEWTSVIILPNAIFFIYLFYDFYQKSYNTPKSQSIKRKESTKTK